MGDWGVGGMGWCPSGKFKVSKVSGYGHWEELKRAVIGGGTC